MLSNRAQAIEPFHVMRILAQAKALEAKGRSIIHMEIGEPDFPSPAGVISAGKQALNDGLTHYTAANGLLELRQLIAAQYCKGTDNGMPVDAEQLVLTPGSSAALQLVMALLLNSGDGIMLADPGYPCNRHLASLFNAEVQSVAVDASTSYQLTAELIEQNWQDNTRVVLIASPSNPTGTIIPEHELVAISRLLQKKGACLIIDEIYHGLIYDYEVNSAANLVAHDGSNVFIINSFSKYYGMTGWRLGWLLMPPNYVEAAIRLAQNMFLAAPTVSQYAALAAFSPEVQQELLRRRDVFKERRDVLLPLIEQAGFKVRTKPAGAFYVYADCSSIGTDSMSLCESLLQEAGVAITPGTDFGTNNHHAYVRFSYANTTKNLIGGMKRIQHWVNDAKR